MYERYILIKYLLITHQKKFSLILDKILDVWMVVPQKKEKIPNKY